MPNYQNGKIYKIVCNITDEYYIGSTSEPTLARRLSGHVRKSRSGSTVTSRIIIERGDYQIILIEKFPCECRDELTARESFFHKQSFNDPLFVNKRIEGRTHKEYIKEYRKNNVEKLQNYHKEYNEINKEHIQARKKEYFQETKDHRRQYCYDNKERITEYYEHYNKLNEEKLFEYRKNYRQLNKDKIKENARKKITCICGSCINQYQKSKHEKSKKHQLYLKSIE